MRSRDWKQKGNGQFSKLFLFFLNVSFSRLYDYLNFCPYFYFKEFLTARATHRKRGIGIERSILEDDISAMRAIAYIQLILIHSWFWRFFELTLGDGAFRNPRSLVN